MVEKLDPIFSFVVLKTITKIDRPEKLRGKKGGQLFYISILIFLFKISLGPRGVTLLHTFARGREK